MSSDHGRAAMERAIMAGLVPEEGARAGTGLRRLLGKPPHRLPSPEYAGHLIALDIEGRLDRLELCAPLRTLLAWCDGDTVALAGEALDAAREEGHEPASYPPLPLPVEELPDRAAVGILWAEGWEDEEIAGLFERLGRAHYQTQRASEPVRWEPEHIWPAHRRKVKARDAATIERVAKRWGASS
jgi:hypothetical protein